MTSKTRKLQALNTFKPYAVFTGLVDRLKNFILLMVGGHLLLIMMGLMAGTKDSTNLPKSTPMVTLLTTQLKDTSHLPRLTAT